MKHDCKNCFFLKLYDRYIPPICMKRTYDLSRTIHCCGCVRYHLYDDTPGYRERDEWVNNDNCILNKLDDSYELPQYKGTYEDLLKHDKESLHEA